MSEPTKTMCECQPESFPFQCARHKMRKSQQWLGECRTSVDIFNLWEQGRGPGQVPLPGLLQRVWNLTSSVADFVADGCQRVSQEDYSARLAVCNTCAERQECVCRKCGCWMPMKAAWRSAACPLNLWNSNQTHATDIVVASAESPRVVNAATDGNS